MTSHEEHVITACHESTDRYARGYTSLQLVSDNFPVNSRSSRGVPSVWFVHGVRQLNEMKIKATRKEHQKGFFFFKKKKTKTGSQASSYIPLLYFFIIALYFLP